MQITPELMVGDIEKSLKFYRDLLGFSVDVLFPETGAPLFARIKSDTAELMLYRENEFREEIPLFDKRPIGGTFLLYTRVDNFDAVYQKLKPHLYRDIYQTDYGTKEFSVRDPDGYVLVISETSSNAQ